MPTEIDYRSLDYHRLPPLERLSRPIFWLLVHSLARVDLQGIEQFPPSGPFILVVNHLHLFDAPIVYSVLPRRTVAFAADKWQKAFFFGWLLSQFGTAIYVVRGEPDRRALTQALDVLKSGGGLAVAPEGTRSRSGSLGKGHTGAAYLATRSGAPIVPMITYGQEQVGHYWRRLRRVPVHIRVGTPIHLPQNRARAAELHCYTEEIMVTLARMLPPSYRGFYADRVEREQDPASDA